MGRRGKRLAGAAAATVAMTAAAAAHAPADLTERPVAAGRPAAVAKASPAADPVVGPMDWASDVGRRPPSDATGRPAWDDLPLPPFRSADAADNPAGNLLDDPALGNPVGPDGGGAGPTGLGPPDPLGRAIAADDDGAAAGGRPAVAAAGLAPRVITPIQSAVVPEPGGLAIASVALTALSGRQSRRRRCGRAGRRV